MRNARGGDAGGQGVGAVATETQFDDKTTTVSVATLRNLAARSARDPAEAPTDPPDAGLDSPPPSPPAFFEKSGAILVVSEPASEVRSSRSATVSEAPRVSHVVPARAKVASIAAILQSASARARALTRKQGASARSSVARWLTVGVTALLAFAVFGKVWGSDIGGIRELAAARAPAVKALMDWSRAFLSE